MGRRTRAVPGRAAVDAAADRFARDLAANGHDERYLKGTLFVLALREMHDAHARMRQLQEELERLAGELKAERERALAWADAVPRLADDYDRSTKRAAWRAAEAERLRESREAQAAAARERDDVEPLPDDVDPDDLW